MTRSIFDPEGGETEHSGNRNMGPSADNDSHMPPSVVDGKVSEEETAEQQPPAVKGLPDDLGIDGGATK
ncbi:MAG TPA: hypothetical protein VG326_15465 [Tepidisphaeraceae bacterium]|jgi:hypothetical protein|nr:hypothetical protein [Tepidisphaeraceae bacterium]